MISDETKDDDILDDDFDIDDFEDDWDEDQADSAEIVSEAASELTSKSEKTFLQKFFLPIIIVVVALFAGIFVLGQGLLSSPSEAVGTGNEVAALDESAPLVDDGRDVTAMSETTDAEMPKEFLPPAAAEESSLRPLPGDVESEQIELADLEAELTAETNDILSSETLDFVDENPLAAPDIETEILFEETPEPATGVIDDGVSDELDFIDSAQNEMLADSSIDEIMASDAPSGEDSMLVAEVENNAVTAAEDMSADSASALESEIEALEAENQTLLQTVNDNKGTITSLNEEIVSLKSAIAAMEAKASETPAAAPSPAVSDISEPKMETAAPKVVAAKPVETAKDKQHWTLKSAQPGKATLSPEGSNDLKNVEVGSVVSGLGRITSIDVENNRWVVRGTKGTVSQ